MVELVAIELSTKNTIMAAFLALPAALLIVFGYGLAARCILAISAWMVVRRLGYLLTTRASVGPDGLSYVSGIFDREVTMVALRDIEGIQLKQFPWQKPFGIGDIIVDRSAGPSIRIYGVEAPELTLSAIEKERRNEERTH